ncbi:MAG TPA: OmpA family protein [Gemmatimonadales bacterium]|nr:OmpA family protein [Gemmatimonadales bacterium]
MRKHLLMASVLALVAAPAVAQDKGTVELGGFVKYTRYDKSFGTSNKRENSYGGGGRVGYFFSKHWELEADGSANATDVKGFFKGFASTALVYIPFHLRLNFNQRLGDNSPFTWLLGAGPAYNRYGKRVASEPGFRPEGAGSDWGVSGITGIRAMLTNWLAFRVDGTIDYIPSPNSGKDAVITQGTGIVAASPPDKNINLGVQAGLSLMLGMCNRKMDGTTISPTSATVAPGGTASFSATATYCGKSDDVIYTVSGPGNVSAMGVYTASGGAGTATVTACGKKNKLCSVATVTVSAPVPPPPPPVARVLTRCELTPATASPRIDQPVSYTVTLYFSDGTTAVLPNAVLSAPGGSVTGNSVSWSTPGGKTVVVNCGAGANGTQVTGTATADVQRFAVVIRDSVYFMIDSTRIYRTDDQTQLAEVAKVLIEHPDIRLIIDGHADADFTVAHNAKLGMNRALAMKKFLADHGVPVDRMTIVVRSFGECVPVASNETAEGRTLNRRAELREFGNETPGPGNPICKEAGRERKP